MSWGIFLVSVFLAVITVVVIVAIWQAFKSQVGRAALTRDEAYRELAERVTEAQRRTATDLIDLEERLANIERVLR